jgi:hypothetical protein
MTVYFDEAYSLISISVKYIHMDDDSILDARGRRELQPILNLFGILFIIIILVVILDKLVQQNVGTLSPAAQGVIVVIFAAFLYFTRDYFKDLIDGYTRKKNR